jgi:hypothetical protein
VSQSESGSKATERRRSQRCLVALPGFLIFQDGLATWADADAGVADVSPEGMFVECDRMANAWRQVVLRVSWGTRVCVAAGHPVRIDGARGFGVRFERANESFRELLDRLGDGGAEDELSSLSDVEVIVT